MRKSARRNAWWERLVQLNACEDAVLWAQEYKSFAAAWKVCDRGDWMFWLAAELKVERTVLIGELVRFIRPICLKHSKDKRVAECLDVCERWANGKATLEEVRTARRAAYAAYAAAAADGAAAAACAAAAAYAAYAAYAAADGAATTATAATTADADADADAAAYAAYAAAADGAAAAAYARSQANKALANHARKHLMKPVMAAWRFKS